MPSIAARLAAVSVTPALVFGALASAALLVIPRPAFARRPGTRPPEAYVQREAQAALQILKSGAPDAVEKARFRAFVDQTADVPRITRFVLGKYARTVTPAQYQDFAQAFRQYANGVYESRLGQYSGQTLQVTGSIMKSPGDVVVSSKISGGRSGQASNVDWRVLKASDGRWRVVDVQVSGVWLAITQQQDFVSTLDKLARRRRRPGAPVEGAVFAVTGEPHRLGKLEASRGQAGLIAAFPIQGAPKCSSRGSAAGLC